MEAFEKNPLSYIYLQADILVYITTITKYSLTEVKIPLTTAMEEVGFSM